MQLRFKKAWMSDTNGTMPYESNYDALENLGRNCMASQCEFRSVMGSALTMTVQVLAVERGRRSEAYTSRNKFTLRIVYSI